MTDDGSIRRLFGVPVVVARAHVSELGATPEALMDLLDATATGLRRRTFATGRLAAARALARSTGTWSWLDAVPQGAPAWPPGLTGSLSHTYELALCVVAPERTGSLGIDLEPLDSASGLARAARICTPGERERALAEAVPAEAVLRLFCAKEALYKALPVPLQAGLRHTSVTLDWTEPPDRDLAVEFRFPGARVAARAIGGHMVAAAVVLDRSRVAAAISAAPRETLASNSASAAPSRVPASPPRSTPPAGC